jgi:hypothetical protein
VFISGSIFVSSASQFAAPPCFFWSSCRCLAELEKQGKSVCSACGAHLIGQTYPLRAPTRQPLYSTGTAAAAATGMIERNLRHPLNHYEPLHRPLVEIVHPPPNL